MRSLRLFAIRHAGTMNRIYQTFEWCLFRADPLLRRIGYDRLERPAAALERGIKGSLFGCRMCGQCILSSTGASCPMNCPKQLRNGPCGGVRSDGRCEVKPEMRCVWVLAYEGSRRTAGGERIMDVQPPLDQRLWGTSAWLQVLRRRTPRSVAAERQSTERAVTEPLRKAA